MIEDTITLSDLTAGIYTYTNSTHPININYVITTLTIS